MISRKSTLKRAILPLGGLALIVAAVASGPVYAEKKKKDGEQDRDMSAAWAGAGGGSVLWLFVNNGGSNDAAGDTAGSKTTQSCTTIWHGRVIPCNGFSP